ncbi:RNA polymerase sigma-70 factor [Chitinophaga sp. Cy-1792]|uniref:RNA polymerase sigma-70 factor n=1 Tax=Chitinophaga sp. Cy-1792 TaxID=2608339 RepID=UPI001422FEFA|nr:RNA polymerase sigma-70 factor [Chitinophaga sp. Cy-1792]NIG53556.1 RNA polymerase sigma-70 factor [Chitinophaga sp. Cy-1792]
MQEDLLSDLIPSFQQGEADAFNTFFKEYYKPLCFFANQLLDSMADAEDIVKDAFVKLWNRKSDFDHPKSIKGFLYTTTRNACLNHLRHQKVHNNFQQEMIYLDDKKGEDLILQRMIQSELIQSIYLEIEKLPEKRQQVFRMIFLEGLKNDEIAEKLGISVFTVKEHKAKALAQLRLRFNDTQLGLFFILVGSLFTIKK